MSKNNTTVNPTNKCAQLYDQVVSKLDNPLVDIFNMQLSLQKKLASMGKGIDYENAAPEECIKDLTVQFRNLTLEFAELLERLPFKEWKTYTPEQLDVNNYSKEDRLEIVYEYCDMFHFFINIGLALGLDGNDLEHLYVTKNKENFDRQKRGY